MANLHIEVDGSRDIYESHDMIDLIEKRLNMELGILSNIHMDPIVVDDVENDAMKAFVVEQVKAVDERLNIHDFRFVEGTTHTNLIFDVSAPFEVKLSDSEIRERIAEWVSQREPTYFTVITVDRE